jgi:hypothetical protein
MQKLCMLILIAMSCVGQAYGRQHWLSKKVTLKERQKEELQALKLKEKYARESLANSGLPGAVRTQLKHELKREQKTLYRRQKDERQVLKDRERLLKIETKLLESE